MRYGQLSMPFFPREYGLFDPPTKPPVFDGFMFDTTEFLSSPDTWVLSPAKLGRLLIQIVHALDVGDREALAQWDFVGRLLRRPRPRASITPTVRRRILNRDGHACRYCRTTEQLEIDHVTPVVFGGGDEDANLQVLCRPCNQAKGPRPWVKPCPVMV